MSSHFVLATLMFAQTLVFSYFKLHGVIFSLDQ